MAEAADALTAGVNADAPVEDGDVALENGGAVAAPSADDLLKAERHRQGWIFLSYEEETKTIAEDTFNGMQDKGYRCWMQSRAKKTDDEDRVLEPNLILGRGVDGAAMCVAFLTKEYEDDWNCQTELEMAFFNQIPIIPVVAERNYRPGGWLEKFTKNINPVEFAAGSQSGICGIIAYMETMGLAEIGHVVLGPRPKPIPIPPEQQQKKKKKSKKDKEEEEKKKEKEVPWTPWFDPVLDPYDDLELEANVTEDNIQLGARVRRGPDWGKRAQRWPGWKADGHPIEASGIIVASTSSQRGELTSAAENDMRATVRWLNSGKTFTYSIGAFKPPQYDLLMESGMTEEEMYSEEAEDEPRDPLDDGEGEEEPIL